MCKVWKSRCDCAIRRHSMTCFCCCTPIVIQNIWIYGSRKCDVCRLRLSLGARRFSLPFNTAAARPTHQQRPHRLTSLSPLTAPHRSLGRPMMGTVGELAALCVKGKRETSCTKTSYGYAAKWIARRHELKYWTSVATVLAANLKRLDNVSLRPGNNLFCFTKLPMS